MSHHNHFTALFPGPSGWAGARRELLDFMVQGKINRGRHSNHPAGRHSIRTNQCPAPPFLTYNNNNNNHFTALCLGLPGWAGTRKNVHPPTTSLYVLFDLPVGLEPSTSYSIHFFTQSVSYFRNTCPYWTTSTNKWLHHFVHATLHVTTLLVYPLLIAGTLYWITTNTSAA